MDGLFLSYARSDDEPFVERLYGRLLEEGCKVWWDRRAMSNRGLTFLQEIRDAIEEAERVILVAGPGAVTSEYVREEWAHALRFAKGVVPILRLGDYELVPEDLSRLHCVDFRESRAFEDALQELLRILAEPMAPAGPMLTEVPSLPPRFQLRDKDLQAITALLLADLQRPESLRAEARVTALHGMEGIGKSVLAAAIARSVPVRRAFAAGVAWLDCAQQADFLRGLAGLGAALDGAHRAEYLTLEAARNRLPAALEGRACLIVLDDLSDRRHLEPFVNALSLRSRILVTTRDRTLVSALGANEHGVDPFDTDAALRMLADWSGAEVALLPAPAPALVAAIGGMPLALALCGSLVRDGASWEDLLAAFEERDLDFAQAPLPNYRYATVRRSLQVSLARLAAEDEQAAQRYLEVAVFRKPRGIPVTPLLALWCAMGSMQIRHARKLLQTLERKALLRLNVGWHPERPALDRQPLFLHGFGQEQVSVHDLQYDFLRVEGIDTPELHRVLLREYATLCERAQADTLGDGYYLDYLTDHLELAGWRDAVAALDAFAQSALAGGVRIGDLYQFLQVGSIEEIRGGRFLPAEVREQWAALLQSFARHGHPVGPACALGWLAGDLMRRVQAAMEEAARGVAFYNALKARVRDELARSLGHQPFLAASGGASPSLEVAFFYRAPAFDTDGRPAIRVERRQRIQSSDALENVIAELEATLTDISDESMLAMLALQNGLQEQQTVLQAMSNVSKMRYDRAMTPLNNLR